MTTELNNKKQSKADKELAADRLRHVRIDAGFPTASHASVTFGWKIKTYSQHEEGIKSFDTQTAQIYSKAFNVSGDWLSSLCVDCSLEYNYSTNLVNGQKSNNVKIKQQIKIEKKLIADRLKQARINAGFPTANHAAIHFGWGINTYSLHEEGIKDFDKDTAVKYSEAFNIDGDWLSSLCRDLLIEDKTKAKIVNEEEKRKRIERQKANKKKRISAKQLLLAREEAGYSSANHAAIKLGWNMRVYLQHETGAKVFDEDTALKYAKAFNVGPDWFSIDEE